MVDISHSEIVLQKHIEISIFFLMYFLKHLFIEYSWDRSICIFPTMTL